MVRYLLLIPALVATLSAAGCGSGSKNDYVQSVNQAEASLQKSLSSLNGIGASSSGAEVATQLERGGKALDSAADDFNDIKPPDDAKHAHVKIVDGLHKLAGWDGSIHQLFALAAAFALTALNLGFTSSAA